MPETSSKNRGKGKDDKPASDKIMQLTQSQLESLIQTMINKATAPMLTQIKSLKKEVAELQKAHEFISEKYDDLTNDYKAALSNNKHNVQELKKLNKRTADLQNKSNEEELKLDELEQYDRRQNLELVGVPHEENEDVTQIVLDLAGTIGVDLEEGDISIAHRLPQKRRSANPRAGQRKSNPAIIVRFISRYKRNEMYENRFKAKEIDNFPVQDMTYLYINKNLTQRRKRLFWKTKQKAIELDYSYIWSNNGQIYVRKDQDNDRIAIKTESDLDNL